MDLRSNAGGAVKVGELSCVTIAIKYSVRPASSATSARRNSMI